jgi:hypothetical protein
MWRKTADVGWTPELIVCADSAYAYSVSDELNIPYIVWGVDNHVRDYQLGVEWDHVFLAHHDGPALPVDDSRGDMTWLPCAYDSEYFTPSPIPMADREYDVCMVGVGYGRRVEIVNAMQAAGLKVFAGTGLLYEDYRDAYHNSRISLCVSAAGDVAQRVFETAAMGCVLLSDPLTDSKRLATPTFPFKHGGYPTEAEMFVNAAKFYLSCGNEWLTSVAEVTKEWAQPHTWDARAQVVLDTMFGGNHAA